MMYDQNLVINYSEKLLLLMGHPNNRNSLWPFNNTCDSLRIDKHYQTPVFNYLFYEKRFIEGTPQLVRDPLVKLTVKGIIHAEEIDNLIFEKTGETKYMDTIQLSLNETLNLVFDRHKQDGFVQWNKHTFRPYPLNLYDAKQVLLKQDIIISVSNDGKRTILNPDISDTNSYKDAVQMLKSSKEPKAGHTLIMPNSTIGNINTGTINGDQSSEIARDSPRIESSKSNTAIKPKSKSWLEIVSWIFGIIVALIAIYEFILKHILHTESLF